MSKLFTAIVSKNRFFCALIFTLSVGSANAEVVIYTAKIIRTMEPALAQATAVAVEDGRVLAVGSEASLQPLLELRGGGRIDRRFADQVLLPGFIDPHVHPSLPAVLTQFPYLAPDDWDLPTGFFPAAKTPQAYRERLAELVKAHNDSSVPFVTWGYHSLWHGDIVRRDLNEWFGNTPVMIWHRSFHEIIANDAALEMLGLTEEGVSGNHEVNWENGHFYEGGLQAILPRMKFLFDPVRFAGGMRNFLAMTHRAGVTTALDMGTGFYGKPEQEINAIRSVAENYPVPTRIILTPIILDFINRGVSPEDALKEVQQWQTENSPRVEVGQHFKLMLDGAIFSGLSQFGAPGYLDGHQGVWMASEDVTRSFAEVFWNNGFQLHAHSNGDAATDRFIELLRGLLRDYPRADHRMTVEHFAYSTEDQTRQLKALGAVVSANPYYHFILSDLYSGDWLGPDRAPQMSRLGSLERAGIPLALHSDNPMAPLSPLTLMWSAAARETINGRQGIEGEKISRETALRAVTIDAAWILGRENDLGSIRAGKLADFTVLEEDPMTVELDSLPHIKVVATVYGGEVYPVPSN